MKLHDFMLSPSEREEAINMSHWTLKEATCYFLDIKPLPYERLSRNDLRVLEEIGIMDNFYDLLSLLVDECNNWEYFLEFTAQGGLTEDSLMPVEALVMWALSRLALKYGQAKPRIAREYIKRFPEKFDPKRREYENDMRLDEVFDESILEKIKFLHDRNIRLDLWVSLCYDSYKLWWGDDLHPSKRVPTKTPEERDKRDAQEKDQLKTFNSWFEEGERYHSLNKGRLAEVVRGFLYPKNTGGRGLGSKNLKGKK